jgi:hypothetical protein
MENIRRSLRKCIPSANVSHPRKATKILIRAITKALKRNKETGRTGLLHVINKRLRRNGEIHISETSNST